MGELFAICVCLVYNRIDYYADKFRFREIEYMIELLMISATAEAAAAEENAFLAGVRTVNNAISSVVWGWPALILLLFVGVLMTVLTKCFQVSHIGRWFRCTIGAVFKDRSVTKHTKDKQISQFQSICAALASTVGTGNIAGVASAIVTGGPGAVFWMWVMAFFGMMTNFAENVLGILYRVKNKDGEWSGGAMYYLRHGLGSKKHCKVLGSVLAVMFCVFCLFASFGIGNMTQINTISTNMNSTFGIPNWLTGIVLMIVAALVVIGGIKRIALVTEKIVPVMVVIYLLGTVAVCIKNISQLGAVFAAIFESAFGIEAVAGGLVGQGVKMAVEMGMKRGVFSNEAGLGSSVMVHCNSNVKEPVSQGMWGIFSVFTDTIVVCSLTAFTILSSGLFDLSTGRLAAEYSDLAKNTGSIVGVAFQTNFGDIGRYFVAIALLLFAFSTALGWSHYGTKAFEYMFGTKATIYYKVVFVAAVMGGATMGENLAWELSDTFNGMMMIPNLIGVLVLSPMVYKCTKNYIDRHVRHLDVEPMLSVHENIQREQAMALEAEQKALAKVGIDSDYAE